MEIKRKSFQGVGNIVRFNWHFYVIFAIVTSLILTFNSFLPALFQPLILIGIFAALFAVISSLAISYYVYDLSGLYNLDFLPNLNNKMVVNTHAGFDETSDIIQRKFPAVTLTMCDFYNPKIHTEVSIKRARKLYPPNTETLSISSTNLPFSDDFFDTSIVIFSAHEIRNEQERIQFFSELKRITSDQIIVTEHLRDFNNFLAYSIGFFHFHSKKSWQKTFEKSGLRIEKEVKKTPFVTTFILQKDGNSL